MLGLVSIVPDSVVEAGVDRVISAILGSCQESVYSLLRELYGIVAEATRLGGDAYTLLKDCVSQCVSECLGDDFLAEGLDLRDSDVFIPHPSEDSDFLGEPFCCGDH